MTLSLSRVSSLLVLGALGCAHAVYDAPEQASDSGTQLLNAGGTSMGGSGSPSVLGPQAGTMSFGSGGATSTATDGGTASGGTLGQGSASAGGAGTGSVPSDGESGGTAGESGGTR